MQYCFNTHTHTQLADTYTPVQLFLNIREYYPEAILFETDSRLRETARSYICFQPLASVKLLGDTLITTYPDDHTEAHTLNKNTDLAEMVEQFISRFGVTDNNDPFMKDGLHGYLCYAAAAALGGPLLKQRGNGQEIPAMQFSFYRFVLVYDHQKQQLSITERYMEDAAAEGIARIQEIVRERITAYPFHTAGDEMANQDDATFLHSAGQGIHHCRKGDVFQVVLSRAFAMSYKGDDFNVYRQLRSINPSPYMFYCDFGGHRLFGSSPEAQITLRDGIATIHPIAGTFRKTGNPAADERLAEQLSKDPKENAEHVMLVDLARNDLSKNFNKVSVRKYKEIHHFSHVLHMVSEVTGADAVANTSPFRILADSFPAGTLSGAPKYRAMQLIDEYEPTARGFYGGCIGYIGFNGDINTAIMIRSVLSKNNQLHYQAGAGIVAASIPQSELEEINNKLGAVRTAIQQAKVNIYENTAY